MIVMQHQVKYSTEENQIKEHRTSMVVTGDSKKLTAMSKTVGWPLAIVAKLILNRTIKDCGVKVPVTPQYYRPVIGELETLGVKFIE